MSLAFSSFIDSHFHIFYCSKKSIESSFLEFADKQYYAVTSAHNIDEFIEQEKLVKEINKKQNITIYNSFGIHPQLPITENKTFMTELLKEKRIKAIGEAGFDLFTKEYKENILQQEKAWNISLELALKYNVPLVIHCRKAIDKIFRDSKMLAKLPSVIFHSFEGNPIQANSILNHKINAYFSFGTPLLFGDKSAIRCIQELDKNRLLLETDSPYQTLRGETETKISTISHVYEKAYELINDKTLQENTFSKILQNNFKKAFAI